MHGTRKLKVQSEKFKVMEVLLKTFYFSFSLENFQNFDFCILIFDFSCAVRKTVGERLHCGEGPMEIGLE